MITTMFDEPLRLTITTTDGKTAVLDAVALTIEGTLPKARGTAALKGEAPQPKSARTYQPAERSDAEIKAVLRGDLDAADKVRTKETQRMVLEVLCAMRVRLFKQATCPYTVRDAQVIAGALAQGVKPSHLARAVMVAGTDGFWRNHGDIRPDQVVKHVAALSSKYQRQMEVMKVVGAMRKLDPAAADALERVIADGTREQADIAIRDAEARVKAATGGAR